LSDKLKDYFMSAGDTEIVAAADGLRWALAAMVCASIWSAFHYTRAARTLREDVMV